MTRSARAIDVDRATVDAFGLADDLEPGGVGAWHAHTRHQLLYSASGVMHLEVRASDSRVRGVEWLLPPQRAAWIPADVEHRVRVSARVALRTIYFRRQAVDGGETVVFAVSPLARAMIVHAMRWGADLPELPDVGAKFFTALAALAEEWRNEPVTFCLPRAETPELARAMRFAMDRLCERPSIEQAARAAGLSARTLERRFATEANTSWRRFVHTARMMRALERLAVPGVRVTDVAVELGFESFGAFSTAFQRYTGETPSAYRKRVAGK